MRLLALDQSSHITGWAIFEDGDLVDCGKFEVSGETGQRLVQVKEEVVSLVENNQINKVIFENIQLQNNVVNNVNTFKVLSMIFGVIMEQLEEENIPYEVIGSSTWKSALGIKGKARADQKRAAQKYVLDTYKVKASQDTCDAICIGACALKTEGRDWSS